MPSELHLPLVVDAEVSGDRVQPGRELRVSTKVVAALDDPEPGVLVDLLGAPPIAHQTQDHVEERSPVAPQQRLEGSGVAFAIRPKQLLVRRMAQIPPPSSGRDAAGSP